MTRKTISAITILIVMCLIGFTSLKSKATEQPELIKAHATAYCLPGKTYTGKEVRYGICATGRSEWIGKTAILYQRLPNGDVGDVLGIYEIEDMGCGENVIDVWYLTIEECQDFMNKAYENNCNGRIYVQVLEALG